MDEQLPAILTDNSAIVSGDRAVSLYNKGYFGQPVADGLRLNGFEALHLFELDRIRIERDGNLLTEEEIIEFFSDKFESFFLRYLVYKDLRNRGYVVNTGEGSSFFFRLYNRGSIPKKDGASYYVTPLQEGGAIKLSELEGLEKLAEKSRKILVVGMVDALGDVSYLQVSKLELEDIGSDKKFTHLTSWNWNLEWKFYQNQ